MAASYDDAVAELFRGSHATFVAERKRLAGELKAAGDKTGAATLAKLGRPPISAWAVNQLWWQARPEFEVLLETAKRLREGHLAATPGHRQAIVDLRARAAKILNDAGNAANEATLRRVATTLSALAAVGGFDPDPAGALTDDRDPPGFEAAGIPVMAASIAVSKAPAATVATVADEAGAAGTSEEERRAVGEEELRQQTLAAEGKRRQEALTAARAEVTRVSHEVADPQRQVMEAEGKLVAARSRLARLELT